MELKGPSFSNGRPSLPTSLLTCRIVSNSSDFAASSLLSCMHSCSYIKRRIRSSSHSRGRGNPEDEDAGGAGPEGEGGGGRLLGPIRENHDVLDLEGPSPPAFLVGEARDGMPMYCGWRVGNDGMGGGEGGAMLWASQWRWARQEESSEQAAEDTDGSGSGIYTCVYSDVRELPFTPTRSD